MGVNDLNLLKSWNPNLLKNKQKIWKERELLKEEDLKIKELNKELAQGTNDRMIDNTTKSKNKGLSWMYESSITDNKNDKKSASDTVGAYSLYDKKQNNQSNKKVLSLKDKQQRMISNDKKVTKPITTNKNNRQKTGNFNKLRNEDPMANLSNNKKSRKKMSKLSLEDPMSKFK